MRHLFVLTFLLFAALVTQSADLTSRIQMENQLQSRVERLTRVYDPSSQVIIKIDYKNYKNELPGSAFDYTHGITPTTLETNDLLSIQITIISDIIKKTSPQLEQAILASLPVDKNKVKLNISAHLDKLPEVNTTLQAHDISKITEQFTENLSKAILYSLLSICLFSALVLFIYARNRSKNQKNSSDQIASALAQIGQNGLGASASTEATLPASLQNLPNVVNSSAQNWESEKSQINELPTASLKELFADCYWSGLDSYAHFIWQNLSFDKKSQLLSQLPFLKKYAEHFSQVGPAELNHHNHPYYFNPSILNHLSNTHIHQMLEKNLNLWPTLGPIRQAQMPLKFEQRLKALEFSAANTAVLSKWENQKASPERLLPLTSQSIYLSEAEEKTILQNTALVPEKFQSLIKSLLWLALSDEKTIADTLARYDARTLASGWVAHPDILQKLESCLPEKKLKLLTTYKERALASKDSPLYQELTQLGLSIYQQLLATKAEEKISQDDAA